MAWRDRHPLQAAPFVTIPRGPEGSKDRKKHHTKKILEDSDTPELVAFFQEHNYQFVKAIFMDTEVTSLKKCLVENCEIDHKMPDSNVDNMSEATKGTLEIISSMSNESKLRTENESSKDVIEKCGSKNLVMEDEEDTDARDVRLLDCSVEKIVPERQLIGKVASREANLTDSMVPSAIKVINDNSTHTSASSENEMESRSISHHSDSSITNRNGRDQCQQHANCQQLLETFLASKPQEGMSQDFLHQHDQGESNCFSIGPLSGPTACTPCSGSISFQSNSSNASSNSFVFPILPSEWNGSPVRMAKADRRQLRKQRSWKMCFLCGKF